MVDSSSFLEENDPIISYPEMKFKAAITSFLLIFFSTFLDAQTWDNVENGLNGGVHGFGIYNDTLVMGGSFTNGGGPPPGGGGRLIEWDSTAFSNVIDDNFGLLVRDVMAWNGDLIVVGDFWNQGQPCVGCNGVARWDGTSWNSLGTGVNNDVLAIATYNGDLVIGGDFEACNGDTAIKRIARWDGTNWFGFDVDSFVDNDVRAVTVYDGELIIGGDFNNASGKGSADGIARWDVADQQWKGMVKPGGIDSIVRALYVDDGKLYVAGHFRDILGDSSMSGIAVWDGNQWSALGTGVNDYVRAIHKYNGELYIGGNFTTADGNPASKIARWNGFQWNPCGGGVDSGYVRAFHEYKGELYVGGSFKKYDGDKTDSPYIARWHNPPPPLVVNLIGTTDVSCSGKCDGEASVIATGGAEGYSYEWDDPLNQTTATATGLCAGNYTVTVEDVGNNTSTMTVTITEPDPVTVELSVTSDYNGSGVSCIGASDGELAAEATGGWGDYSYRWEGLYWIYTDTASNLPEGAYTVTVTDAENCSGTASAVLTGPEECPSDTESENLTIYSAFSPNGDGTNDTWVIKGLKELPVTVEVFNRWGDLIFRSTSQGGNPEPWDGTYFGLELPSAAYYYIVYTDGKTHKGTVTIIR